MFATAGSVGQTIDDESIGTVQAAIERGVCMIDTADFYGNGRDRMLIGNLFRADATKCPTRYDEHLIAMPD